MWKSVWNWLMGRGWEDVEERIRACPESREQEVTGAAEDGSHGPGADRSKETEGHSDDVSDGNEGPIGKWSKGHPCYAVAKVLATLCPCPKALWEAQVQPDGLVLLAEEIAKQQSLPAAAWMLLAAVSQLCKENQERKGAEEKDLEGSQPGQGRNGDKAVCLGRGISSGRGQLCASRKALEASRSSRPTAPEQSHQRPRGARVLRKPFTTAQSCQEGAPGCSVHSRLPGLETTPAGGRPRRCPAGAAFAGQQDARVVGSRQLPSRLASKAQEHKPSRGARLEPLRAAMCCEGLKVELQRRPPRSRTARKSTTSSMPGKPGRTAGTGIQPRGAGARAKNGRAVEVQGPPTTTQGLLQRNLERSQIPSAAAQPVPTASPHVGRVETRASGNARRREVHRKSPPERRRGEPPR